MATKQNLSEDYGFDIAEESIFNDESTGAATSSHSDDASVGGSNRPTRGSRRSLDKKRGAQDRGASSIFGDDDDSFMNVGSKPGSTVVSRTVSVAFFAVIPFSFIYYLFIIYFEGREYLLLLKNAPEATRSKTPSRDIFKK
jgi:hypothetical protein